MAKCKYCEYEGDFNRPVKVIDGPIYSFCPRCGKNQTHEIDRFKEDYVFELKNPLPFKLKDGSYPRINNVLNFKEKSRTITCVKFNDAYWTGEYLLCFYQTDYTDGGFILYSKHEGGWTESEIPCADFMVEKFKKLLD